MVSVFVSGSSGPVSSPVWEHCVVFFTFTVPLSTQVYKMSTGELNAGVMDKHPIQGVKKYTLVTSCYRNWDKRRSVEPLGSYVDLHDLRQAQALSQVTCFRFC